MVSSVVTIVLYDVIIILLGKVSSYETVSDFFSTTGITYTTGIITSVDSTSGIFDGQSRCVT